MLDAQDLQAIRGIVKEEIKGEGRIIEKNILTEVDLRMDEKLSKLKQEIVISVGEMLEDNVFPQFEEVHRELRRMNTVIGWQH